MWLVMRDYSFDCEGVGMRNPLKVLWKRIERWDDKRFYDAYARRRGAEDWADYIYKKWGVKPEE